MDKKEKLFMAALGWLHDGLLFGCLFLIPAAVPGQGRTAGILTGSGLLLGLMSAVSWLCVRKLRSGVLYGAAAALFSGAAALLAFFLGSGYGIVWQTALPAAVLLLSLMLFGMRATDKIRKNRAARELREMPGVIPDGQKGGLAEILDEPAPPHLLLFGAVYLWAVTQDAPACGPAARPRDEAHRLGYSGLSGGMPGPACAARGAVRKRAAGGH